MVVLNYKNTMRRCKFLILMFLIIFLTVSCSADTVYITNTGSKYHESDCYFLYDSKIAISVDSAINQGYTSCSVCNPHTGNGDTNIIFYLFIAFPTILYGIVLLAYIRGAIGLLIDKIKKKIKNKEE